MAGDIELNSLRNGFEKLFVNNLNFEKVKAYQARFNPIKIMRMEKMEIRHSNILGWLLDPQESHGFGDVFLKALLAQAFLNTPNGVKPTALEILQANMMRAEVRLEWHKIDILVRCPDNKWVFVIENKFGSSQRKDQLFDYIKECEKSFGDGETEIRGVFLTLDDEEPDNSKINEAQLQFVSINYNDIVEILEQKIMSGRYAFSAEIEMFLNQYLEVLKVETDQSNEQRDLEKIAKQLYIENKKAIDFIVEFGSSTDFSFAVDEVFGEDISKNTTVNVANKKLVYFAQDKKVVSFLPEDWLKAFGGEANLERWVGCENWWHGYPLICRFSLKQKDASNEGLLRIYAEAGPLSNFGIRQALITNIECSDAELVSFNSSAAKEGAKYSKFLKNTTNKQKGNSIGVKDVSSSEDIADGMRTLIKRFGETFDLITPTLQTFMNEMESKND